MSVPPLTVAVFVLMRLQRSRASKTCQDKKIAKNRINTGEMQRTVCVCESQEVIPASKKSNINQQDIVTRL